MAEFLTRTAKFRHAAHQLSLPFPYASVPLLREIYLEPPSKREDYCRLLLHLDDCFCIHYTFLIFTGDRAKIHAEAPSHQIPWFSLPRHASAFKTSIIHAILEGIIPRYEVHIGGNRLGHERTERPVARHLKFRAVFVKLIDIMPQIAPELLPAELAEFIEARILRFPRDLHFCFPIFIAVFHGYLFPVGFNSLSGIILVRTPALPVDPYAIDAVLVNEFLELRYEQFINIRAKSGSRPITIRFSCPVDPCPVRVMHNRFPVQHTGVMHIERHPVTCGHIPPNTHSVPDYTRSRIPRLCRVT